MEDFLHLDEHLHDDEKLIRATVARFVGDHVLPIIADAYEQGQFPKQCIQAVADLGLLGMTLPAKYGGSEASDVSYGLVCQELERGDSGLRSFVSVQSALAMHAIYTLGSESQKQAWLPDMAKAKVIACFGLTEPDAGSDPASMRTTAKKTKQGWCLKGTKTWITNAPFADIGIIWAKTEEGIRGFIVDLSLAGCQVNEIKHKFSMRASSTGELIFDDCVLPNEALLPGSDRGLASALQCLTQARYGIAWGAMGAAQACFDIAKAYTASRQQFSRPVAATQLVQRSLVMMFTEIVKAQCLHLRLGRLKENGQATSVMISLAKRDACRQALMVAREARNLLGGNGISLEYHVIRHLTNLETVLTYEGTDNIHTLIVGQYLTGCSAF